MNKDNLFKILNGLGLTAILRSQKKTSVTVLSLHRISPENDFFWNPMKPDTFRSLLIYLKKNYHVIRFNDIPDILKKGAPSKPYAVISFDDGYYDFYEYAMPLLLQYKLPANHNIVNACAENNTVIWTQRLNFIFDHCRKNNTALAFESTDQHFTLDNFNGNWMSYYLAVYKWMLTLPLAQRVGLIASHEQLLSLAPAVKMMNWQQVAECAANGIEIGSHTYSHDVLSTITDEAVLHKEIVQSTLEIQQKINKKINILALPNGEGHEGLATLLTGGDIEYVLYVGEKVNAITQLNSPLKSIYRINLVEENYAAMALRTELFHEKMKKYV